MNTLKKDNVDRAIPTPVFYTSTVKSWCILVFLEWVVQTSFLPIMLWSKQEDSNYTCLKYSLLEYLINVLFFIGPESLLRIDWAKTSLIHEYTKELQVCWRHLSEAEKGDGISIDPILWCTLLLHTLWLQQGSLQISTISGMWSSMIYQVRSLREVHTRSFKEVEIFSLG